MSSNAHYNCFGYAVNFHDWLLVGDDYFAFATLWYDQFGLKAVNREDMVLGKRYVAFRYCADDFHFCRRDANGHWRHKMGGQPPKTISQKAVFSSHWDTGFHRYNSKVYLYEVVEQYLG